ncbi:MAG: hypothetical protein ACFB22_10510 [Rhodothalassiaceae bacterium]
MAPTPDPTGRTRQAGERTTHAARDAAEHVGRSAQEEAERQTHEASQGLHQTADRLRAAAGDLSAQEGWLKAMLERAAGGLDQASQYMSGRRTGQMMDDARHFARDNPAAFLGGAAALGFILARAGRGSLEQIGQQARREGFDHHTPTAGTATQAHDVHGATSARPASAGAAPLGPEYRS